MSFSVRTVFTAGPTLLALGLGVSVVFPANWHRCGFLRDLTDRRHLHQMLMCNCTLCPWSMPPVFPAHSERVEGKKTKMCSKRDLGHPGSDK
jgi:hypothetical protein